MINWKRRLMAMTILMLALIISTNIASAQVMNLKSTPTSYYSYHDIKDDKVYENSRMFFHTLNGRPVFCVEAGIAIRDVNGKYFYINQSNDLNVELNQESIENEDSLQSRIAYLGYFSKDSRNVKDYVFTQMLIWQTLPESAANGVDSAGNYRSYFTDEKTDEEYEMWKNVILEKTKKWEEEPEFCSKTIEITAGQEVVLNDENSIFEDYESFTYDKNGITISHKKGENHLTVITKEDCKGGLMTISKEEMKELGAIKYPAVEEKNFLFTNTKYQDMATYGSVEPMAMSLNINVTPVGRIELLKLGEEIVFSEEKGKVTLGIQNKLVEGCVFELSNEKGEVIEYLETDKTGKSISRNLLPGKYYIKEVSTPAGLVNTGETYEVEVLEGTVTKEISNSHQEIMFEVQKNILNYPYSDLSKEDVYEAITFGLFFTGPDNSYDDKLVVSLKPDSQGIISYQGCLPEGNYYLKELTTHDKYKIDETEYCFQVQYDDSGQDIIEIEINGGNAIFNEYIEIPEEETATTEVPETGDSSKAAVSLTAVFLAGTALMGLQRRKS